MSGPNSAALRKTVEPEPIPGRPFAIPSRARRSAIVFADAILEDARGARSRRAVQTGLAFGLQGLLVAALLVVPLLFTQTIDLGAFDKTMLIAPRPPAAPPPPPAAVHQAVAAEKPVLVAKLMAPTAIPKRVDANPEAAPAIAPDLSGVAGGVPGGIAGGVIGGMAAPLPPPPPRATKPKGPARIFSGVKPPALLYTPALVYPLLARENHVSGNVVIEAIIDEQGNVTQARVVSGPGLLVRAALQAVLHRKYAPTVLDGQPVSIRFDVTVAFNLR
jgi:periplasmic protein TonB